LGEGHRSNDAGTTAGLTGLPAAALSPAALSPAALSPAALSPAAVEAERCFARGLELRRRGELEAASRAFGQALAQDPRHHRALLELGQALRTRGLRTAAAATLRRALALAPDAAEALNALGLTLRELGQPGPALAELHRLLELQPASADAHHNLGLALADLGHLEEALYCFERALQLRPEMAPAAWERSIALLTAGRYREGFPGLEARWRLRRLPRPHADLPAWDGAPLAGRTILLFNEQAYGDGIMFARFVPALQALGAGAALLECHRPLARLLRTLAGVDRVLVRGEPRPRADLAASLLSLPGLLGLDRDAVAMPPYLAAPPVGRPALRRPPGARLAVGLCWAGRPTHKRDRHRSAGLKAFLPLLGRAEVAFYSLQKGPAAAEVAQQGVEALVRDLSGEIEDLADAAHWISQLDLVISVDTAIAHLAGALGKPCWVTLPWLVDWRWGRDGDETPWYQRMLLFRQPTPGDWVSVVALVDEALGQVLAT